MRNNASPRHQKSASGGDSRSPTSITAKTADASFSSFADSMLFDANDGELPPEDSSSSTIVAGSTTTTGTKSSLAIGGSHRFSDWDSTMSSRTFDEMSARDRVFREVVGRTLASFSVSDPKYQKYEEFPPDKIDDWVENFPDHATHSEVALFNQAHLKEVRDMADALEVLRKRGPLEEWSLKSLRVWYRAHYLWTSRRFQVYRSYSLPIWEKRFHYPTIVKDAQDEFQKDLHTLAYIFDGLEVGSLVEDELLDAWSAYSDHLELAMKLFTDIGMMLFYAYYSYEEHEKMLVKSDLMLKTIQHTHAIGAVINVTGVQTFRETILEREAKHVGVTWEEFYRERWEDYCENVAGHLDALIMGDPEYGHPDSSGSLRTSLRKGRRIALPDDVVPFNPLDPKYQVNEHFPPDKLDEWINHSTAHVEESSWVQANHAHRIEVWHMKEALQFVATRGDTSEWVVTSIKKWWAIHSEWTMSRFETMRALTFPALGMRFHYPTRLVEAQESIESQIRTIADLVDKLSPGDDAWRLYDLLDAWSAYEKVATKGLDLTEPMGIMLFHSFFSIKEADAIVKAEHHRMSPLCIGAIIYYGGKDKAAKLSRHFFEAEMRLKEYTDESVIHIQALRSGLPPKEGKQGKVVKFLTMLHDGLGDEQA